MSTATSIRSLRLVGVNADPTAVRLRAARQLTGVEIRPPGLPPSVELVVRRVRDPVPGSVGGETLRPPDAWERAVRDHLAVTARTAARPDDGGRVSVNADAVLFDDRAELVAAVVNEIVRGDCAATWWLWAVLPDLSGGAVLQFTGGDPSPLLAGHPRLLPAILSRLVRWRAAAPVAERLGLEAAQRTLSSLVEAYRLPRELGATATEPNPSPRTVAYGGSKAEDNHPVSAVSRSTSAAFDAPWVEWIPRELGDGHLPAVVEQLFGIGLGLIVVPRLIRTTGFLKATLEWRRTTASGRGNEIRPQNPHRRGVVDPPTSSRETWPDSLSRGPESTSPAGAVDRSSPAPPPSTDRSLDEQPSTDFDPAWSNNTAIEDSAAINGGDRRSNRPTTDGVHRSGRRDSSSINDAPGPSPGPQIDDDQRAVVDPVTDRSGHRETESTRPDGDAQLWESGHRVVTNLGGVCYLIHVLEELDLPACFEEDWLLASTAGPWGSLDLVSRGLFGRRFGEVSTDPLWQALARLSLWPDPPEEVTPETADFRLPPGWNRILETEQTGWCWAAARDRLRLWSCAGFLVADVSRTGCPPSTQARTELGRFAGSESRSEDLTRRPLARAPMAPEVPFPTGCPSRYGQWLRAIVPAIQHRLRLALGTATPLDALLEVPATLWIGSSHIDLVIDLSNIDLAVRLAGLDHDPGWLPAYGRVIQFHFS